MKKLTIVLGLLAVLVIAACDTAEQESAATETAAVPPPAVQTENAAPADSHEGHDHADGSIVALASGEEVGVLSVAQFDERLKDLSGLVAIEGRVKEAFPDRGALVLVDCANMDGCGDGCCPQTEVPVRLAIENYSGELPTADAEVVVIGDLTLLEMGYELAVREIRKGDEVLLQLKS